MPKQVASKFDLGGVIKEKSYADANGHGDTRNKGIGIGHSDGFSSRKNSGRGYGIAHGSGTVYFSYDCSDDDYEMSMGCRDGSGFGDGSSSGCGDLDFSGWVSDGNNLINPILTLPSIITAPSGVSPVRRKMNFDV